MYGLPRSWCCVLERIHKSVISSVFCCRCEIWSSFLPRLKHAGVRVCITWCCRYVAVPCLQCCRPLDMPELSFLFLVKLLLKLSSCLPLRQMAWPVSGFFSSCLSSVWKCLATDSWLFERRNNKVVSGSGFERAATWHVGKTGEWLPFSCFCGHCPSDMTMWGWWHSGPSSLCNNGMAV